MPSVMDHQQVPAHERAQRAAVGAVKVEAQVAVRAHARLEQYASFMMIQGTPNEGEREHQEHDISGLICDSEHEQRGTATNTMSRPFRMASGRPWNSNGCPSR